VGWLALLVAWCASISIGLNSPALAAGPLAAVLLGPTWEPGVLSAARLRSATRFAVTVGLAAALVLVWGTARFCLIYRDGPYTEVNQPLDDVLAGGAGLRTNPRTFALMSDLKHAVSLTEGRPYAVVADFPAHWARAKQHNPLSIDWPQSTELNTPALRARVIGDLEALRAGGCIVAQNVAAGPFAERTKPIEDDSYYFVLTYVRTHFRKIAGTRWFDLYE
jgi:hypothetical protein